MCKTRFNTCISSSNDLNEFSFSTNEKQLIQIEKKKKQKHKRNLNFCAHNGVFLKFSSLKMKNRFVSIKQTNNNNHSTDSDSETIYRTQPIQLKMKKTSAWFFHSSIFFFFVHNSMVQRDKI